MYDYYTLINTWNWQGYVLELHNFNCFINSIFKDVSMLGVDCMESLKCRLMLQV